MKKVLRYLLFAAIGVVFIYFTFRNEDPADLYNKIARANFLWVGLAWLAGMISNLSRALRWTMLMEPLGYKPRKVVAFHGVMIGYLINFVIPRGGEVARAAAISTVERIPMTTVVGSVVAERVMDVICMAVVMLLALALQYDIIIQFFNGSATGTTDGNTDSSGPGILLYIAITGVLGILAFLFFRKKYPESKLVLRLDSLLQGFWAGIKALVTLKKPWLFVFHSVVIWTMYYLMVYFCFYAIPETSHLGTNAGLTVLVLSTVAILLPAPGGLGTFHFFVAKGLVLYGIVEADGKAYATIAHASQMLMFIFFGSLSLFLMIPLKRRAKEENG